MAGTGWRKALGLAGLTGVAATGVVLARAERRRRALTPEQVRDRLRARHAELASAQHAVPRAAGPLGAPQAAPPPGRGPWWRRRPRRR